jgi:hypothetical protein
MWPPAKVFIRASISIIIASMRAKIRTIANFRLRTKLSTPHRVYAWEVKYLV